MNFFKIIAWIAFFILLIKEFFSYQKGKSSERWKRHIATIVDVTVDVDVHNDDGVETHYNMPFVRYEYTYNGRSFKSKKMALNDRWSTDYGDSSGAVVGVNPGGDIVIYINPKNPKKSVLSKGYKGHNLMVLFVVFVFALASSFAS